MLSLLLIAASLLVSGENSTNATLSTNSSTLLNATLIEGVPQNGTVATGAYLYYRFVLLKSVQAVTFAATAITGDPDLYISNDGNYPNASYYRWANTAYGSVLVTITDPAQGEYLIGVYGYYASNFTIVAYVSVPQNITDLQNGVPRNGSAVLNEYVYYRFVLTGRVPYLYFTVNRTFGDPDIYITNNGLLPNATNFQWRDTTYGNVAVTIENPVPSEYLIAVYGYSTTNYTILVKANSTDNITDLQNGVARNGSATIGVFVYYRFVLDSRVTALTINATAFSGDPDLYISNNGVLPTGSNYQWRDIRIGDVSVRITDPVPGEYLIGVYGFSNTTFSVVASVNGTQNMTTLTDGVATGGSVNLNAYNYYRFVLTNPQKSWLVINVVPFSGDPDLFVRNDGHLPNRSSYQWAAFDLGEVSITIPNPVPADYLIAVYGFTTSDYKILAYTTNSNLTQLHSTLQESNGGKLKYGAKLK